MKWTNILDFLLTIAVITAVLFAVDLARKVFNF